MGSKSLDGIMLEFDSYLEKLSNSGHTANDISDFESFLEDIKKIASNDLAVAKQMLSEVEDLDNPEDYDGSAISSLGHQSINIKVRKSLKIISVLLAMVEKGEGLLKSLEG